jgi:hypothetical protein
MAHYGSTGDEETQDCQGVRTGSLYELTKRDNNSGYPSNVDSKGSGVALFDMYVERRVCEQRSIDFHHVLATGMLTLLMWAAVMRGG